MVVSGFCKAKTNKKILNQVETMKEESNSGFEPAQTQN
jgi:hypothetical protein